VAHSKSQTTSLSACSALPILTVAAVPTLFDPGSTGSISQADPGTCGSSTLGPACRASRRPSTKPPYFHAAMNVEPVRQTSRSTIGQWWLHERPRVDMRAALAGLPRFIVTPRVSKHRLFSWLNGETLPDSATIAFARDDDYTFGVLHSRVHELWALTLGTQLETRPRYTPTTCFETFPFPHATPEQRAAIAETARELDRLRRGWLDPEGWSELRKKRRTLTNLYNERPQWLLDVHERVDRAVLAAYGWPSDIARDDLLKRLLEVNLAREPAAE
jgi:hypothetical protein